MVEQPSVDVVQLRLREDPDDSDFILINTIFSQPLDGPVFLGFEFDAVPGAGDSFSIIDDLNPPSGPTLLAGEVDHRLQCFGPFGECCRWRGGC